MLLRRESSRVAFSPTTSEPRRSDSWKQEEIILFNEANDNLSLVRRDQINCRQHPGSHVVDVPRWNNTQDVYVTTDDGSQRYVATVKLDRLGHGQKFKRLLGTVKQMYVFDSAIPRMPLVR
ncbi:MAG: hypothetical protein M1816_001152 [Peltula sp. TS41687]|nr:MAG: hypothetical protein M1816_001152 [Peltula sp. TS41687]